MLLNRLQHQADRLWRRYRWYLRLPSYLAYRRWLAHQRRQIPADQPLVVFDFRDTRIDGPQGRRFYTLFMFFVRAGYYPLLARSYLFMANIGVKEKRHTLAEDFSILEAGRAPLPTPPIVVTDRPHSRWADQAERVVRIDYRPGFDPDDGTVPMPFPLFPGVYARGQDTRIATYRDQPRQWGVLFGGDALAHKYNQPSITRVYGKVPRTRALDLLAEQLPGALHAAPTDQARFDALLERDHPGLVVMNTRHCRVPVEDWLTTLARARCYLALPGYRYPMSHNVIEALAVGSVPILQYPELFHPPLTDGDNCLVFTAESDLPTTVRRALDLPDAELRRMAANAARYYDNHLAPQATVDQLLAHPGRTVRLRLVPFLKPDGGYA